jgi:hypothetical protein
MDPMVRHNAERPTAPTYLFLTSLVSVFVAALAVMVNMPAQVAHKPLDQRDLLMPVIALVGVTALAWVLMFVYRNLSVMRGIVSMQYYRAYSGDAPPEWVERPARAFMNLLEVPVLFYVLCILMLQTQQWDKVQSQLAWWFVASRVLHACAYIVLNQVPLRLATYLMGCVTLAVMWWRFAASVI